MNPLDYMPKWALALLFATFAATSCKLKIENGKLSLEVEKHATRIAELREGIAASQAASASQRAAMEAKAREAAQAALVREKSLAADRARAVTELDGLRLAVSRTKAGFGLRADGSTLAPSLDYTDTLADLFVQCSARYIDMAAKADGHAFDALTLQESWPRNPISKLESPP